MNLYLDISGGISGDMFMATLLGLGVDFEHFRRKMNGLSIREEFDIRLYPMKKESIQGLKADVVLMSDVHYHDHSHGHDHPHEHQEHHEHTHVHEHHSHEHHTHTHHHRHLKDIERIIEQSDLSKRAKDLSQKVFLELAQAEARVHGTSIDAVHFHEVGAVDSIVDIVGVCVLIDMLSIEKVYYNSLPMGGGQIKTEHGMMPIPAPATLKLMEGMKTRMTVQQGEMVTPTGAALLRGLSAEVMPFETFEIQKTSIGCGQKDFDIPNILRGILFRQAVSDPVGSQEKLWIVECNIDDMTGEMMADAIESLLEKGALDAWIQPIIMKKGRPAYILSALAAKEMKPQLIRFFLEGTTTLGVRCYEVERSALPRENRSLMTEFGEVRVKVVQRPDGEDFKMEFEDIKNIARQRDISVLRVQEELKREQDRKNEG